jgi:hypothetical protein
MPDKVDAGPERLILARTAVAVVPDALDVPMATAGVNQASFASPVAQMQVVHDGASETVKLPIVAPTVSWSRVARAEQNAEPPTVTELQAGDVSVAGAYVFRPDTAPNHDGLPLLVWVMGLSCLLTLKWERSAQIPALGNRERSLRSPRHMPALQHA